ncbi:MAG: DUF4003 family protein [Clostridiales bacterium]|nr:DUF4003 family protein [Clostridiales bacterium]
MYSTSTDPTHLRFAENFRNIKKVFKLDYAYMSLAASGILSVNGVDADITVLTELKGQFNDKMSSFSVFKQELRPVAVAMMNLYGDHQRFLDELAEVYSAYKSVFRRSLYLGVAALMTVRHVPYEFRNDVIHQTKELYTIIKKEHSVITSDEDLLSYWLMAIISKSPEEIFRETELYFELFKNAKLTKNSIQALGNILTVYSGDPTEKANAAVTMLNEFKASKRKYSTSHHEIQSLGLVACSCDNIKTFVRQAVRTDKVLLSQKGFSVFSVPSTQRLMYASLLTQKENEDMGFYTSPSAFNIPNNIVNEAIICNSATALTIAARTMILTT